jgi:hypothetical protein
LKPYTVSQKDLSQSKINVRNEHFLPTFFSQRKKAGFRDQWAVCVCETFFQFSNKLTIYIKLHMNVMPLKQPHSLPLVAGVNILDSKWAWAHIQRTEGNRGD